MKSTIILFAAAFCAASMDTSLAASGSVAVTRRLRTQEEVADTDEQPSSVPSYSGFHHVAIGHQCAYDPKLDPSLYPCAEGGQCVRTSATYGKCVTKEEAKTLATSNDEEDDDEDDDEEEGDEAEEDDNDGKTTDTAA